LRRLKAQGYQVAVYYFSLASPSLAVRRVRLRVAMGGHDVPADVIRRRFDRSLNNFFSLYTPHSDRWAVFDNSATGAAHLLATQEGDNLQIKEPKKWLELQKHLTSS
jgi:predicted ABC-type ATPase